MFDFLQMVPAQYRKWIYAVAGLIAFGVGVWRASDGHWDEALYLALTSMVNGMAGKNVDAGSAPAPGSTTRTAPF